LRLGSRTCSGSSTCSTGSQDARPGRSTPPGFPRPPLGTVTVALVGLLAAEALGETAGLVALALAAVYPALIELSGTLVAENLLTPLVLGAVWLTLRARRARRPLPHAVGAGLLIGLAALTHEEAVVVLIPLLLSFAVIPRGSIAERAKLPAVLLAAAVLAIVPWTIRNALVMHRFIPISDETGITLVGTYNRASAANPRIPYQWRIYYDIPGESTTSPATRRRRCWSHTTT
jgi:4-amino-4-deoxy-L-arabinose transferase-like glycosyltransferase